MKKLLLLIAFCFITITAFAQLTKEGAYKIFGSDWVRVADYSVIANMADSTMTFTNKKTNKSETYTFKEIPDRYFLQIHTRNGKDCYYAMDVLVFVNNGKYGVIDDYGNVWENGTWSVDEYDVYEYYDTATIKVVSKSKKEPMIVSYVKCVNWSCGLIKDKSLATKRISFYE